MKEAVEINLPAIGIKKSIGFPNIGQTVQIESLKQTFTGGKYAMLTFNTMATTETLLDIVDAISYMGVMIGVDDFCKAFKVDHISRVAELQQQDERIQELLDQYRNVYDPFFNEINPRTDRTKYRLKKMVEEVGQAKVKGKKSSKSES